MTKLPEIFERMESQGKDSGAEPFSYDVAKKQFRIGNGSISVEMFDPYYFIPPSKNQIDGIPINDILNHPALLMVTDMILGGPKLHKWAAKNRHMAPEIVEVMQDAYTAIEPHIQLQKGRDMYSHGGFNAGLFDDGSIGLQVQGDCACLQANPYGTYVRAPSETGFVEYSLHNADTKAQRTSLYAGLGHMARLAAS